MTSLQIDRNNWLEAKRHNAEGEAENRRHNQEMERLTGESNAETERAHRAAEAQAASSLSESIRHSQALEGLQASAQAEAQRSNLAREAENIQHDRAMDKINAYKAVSTNKQGWAKLSLDKQTTMIENALTAEKTLTQKLSNAILDAKKRAGLPKLEVAKLQAEVRKLDLEIASGWDYLAMAKEKQDRELTMNEKKVESENNRRTMQNIIDFGKLIKDLAGTVISAIPSGADVPVE